MVVRDHGIPAGILVRPGGICRLGVCPLEPGDESLPGLLVSCHAGHSQSTVRSAANGRALRVLASKLSHVTRLLASPMAASLIEDWLIEDWPILLKMYGVGVTGS